MKLFISIISLVILSGCATSPTYSYGFMDTQNRPHSDVVIDQAKCGALNGSVDRELFEYYNACMEKHGYKIVRTEN